MVTAACAVGIRNLPLPIESVKAFEGTAAGHRPDNLVTPSPYSPPPARNLMVSGLNMMDAHVLTEDESRLEAVSGRRLTEGGGAPPNNRVSSA